MNPLTRPIIPYIISLIFYARHSSAWAFAPSNIHGSPKPLPSSNSALSIGKNGSGRRIGKMGEFIDGEELYSKGVSGAWVWWDVLLEKVGGESGARQILLAFAVLVLARFWYLN